MNPQTIRAKLLSALALAVGILLLGLAKQHRIANTSGHHVPTLTCTGSSSSSTPISQVKINTPFSASISVPTEANPVKCRLEIFKIDTSGSSPKFIPIGPSDVLCKGPGSSSTYQPWYGFDIRASVFPYKFGMKANAGLAGQKLLVIAYVPGADINGAGEGYGEGATAQQIIVTPSSPPGGSREDFREYCERREFNRRRAAAYRRRHHAGRVSRMGS